MTLEIADLFCGAGGTSTGALQAARALGFSPRLTAVNHWETAVATHSLNHPDARHLCAAVDDLNPRELFKGRRLHLLWASPECTHHSRARGGRPMSDQSRATGHCVTRWAEALRPEVIIVENVPEFESWGPLGRDGRPLKSKRGATFRAWVEMIRFRMLQPHELAAAQGFPSGYQFRGSKTDVVRQIGNAVPCGLSRALVSAALAQDAKAHWK